MTQPLPYHLGPLSRAKSMALPDDLKAERAKHHRREGHRRRREKQTPEQRSTMARRRHLKRDFGITVEVYDGIEALQGGLCAICGKPEMAVARQTKKPRRLALDHCHTTEKLRDLLCTGCNQGLGAFRDNPSLLRAAATYLEAHAEHTRLSPLLGFTIPTSTAPQTRGTHAATQGHSGVIDPVQCR